MTKKTIKLFALLLAMAMIFGVFAACQPKAPATTETTETPATTEAPVAAEPENNTPLVVAYSNFSAKFSPFYSDSGYDTEAMSQTQIALGGIDRVGAMVFKGIEGETRNYNGTDYLYTGPADLTMDYDEATDITTYTSKLREDLVFSDGKPVTADDVIFSYYVYLDKAYVGSTTLNSYPILGLKAYQQNNSLAEDFDPATVLADIANDPDLQKAMTEGPMTELLASELEWVKTLYGNADYASYTEKEPVAKDLFAMFYSMDENYDSHAVESEEQVLKDVIAQYGYDYKALAGAYGDDTYLDAAASNVATEIGLPRLGEGQEVPNIAGIKKIDQYTVQVQMKGFNAPAVYSAFGIYIAPLHYYGDAALYDYDNNKFGFPRGDLSIVESKTSTPMGAGPYKFIEYKDKVVYYEANDLYFDGVPKIKYMQFKETTSAEVAAGVVAGTVDVGELTGSKSYFNEIRGYNSNGELSGDVVTTNRVDNLGYGYVGIMASRVNVNNEPGSDASKNFRKALGTLISVYRDVSIDSYYGDAGSIINYPISNTSWAAPRPTDPDYKVAFSTNVDGTPIYTPDMNTDARYVAAKAAALKYFEAAGFTVADGKITAVPANTPAELTLWIPGDGTGDHPSFAIVTDVANALAELGYTLHINDLSNSALLWDGLDAGEVDLWCAAWQTTPDPDMYQIYFSTNSPGMGGSDSNHYRIADETLDKLILDARTSDDQAYRKSVYKQALDVVVDWAVEVPIYQRQNCTVFSSQRVNLDTVTPDITTYWKWFAEVHKLEMR